MNLPNKITMVRMILIPVFVLAFLINPNSFWPVLLFVIASLTDFLDGYLARKLHLVTNFGKFMDPLADKILTQSAFILLVGAQRIAAWIVIIIIARELMITGLRTLAASQGITIAASIWGKYKTTIQMITCVYFLLGEGFLPDLSFWHAPWVGILLLSATVFFTLLSGVDYLWKNKGVLRG